MAEAKQATTIVAHRALAVRDLAVEMWTSPWIVELSRNSRICEITIMFFPFRFRFVLFFNGNDFTLPSQFQIVTWLTEGCFKSVCACKWFNLLKLPITDHSNVKPQISYYFFRWLILFSTSSDNVNLWLRISHFNDFIC